MKSWLASQSFQSKLAKYRKQLAKIQKAQEKASRLYDVVHTDKDSQKMCRSLGIRLLHDLVGKSDYNTGLPVLIQMLFTFRMTLKYQSASSDESKRVYDMSFVFMLPATKLNRHIRRTISESTVTVVFKFSVQNDEMFSMRHSGFRQPGSQDSLCSPKQFRERQSSSPHNEYQDHYEDIAVFEEWISFNFSNIDGFFHRKLLKNKSLSTSTLYKSMFTELDFLDME